MSFLRRNNNQDEGAQAVPQAPQLDDINLELDSDHKDEKESRGGLIGWIGDTYNGLYRVVIAPSMPTRATIVVLIIGIIIGMVWAYLISPVVFVGANPNRLNDAAQDQWVRMVAVGFDPNSRYSVETAQELLSRIDNPSSRVQRLLTETDAGTTDNNALQQLSTEISTNITGTPAPQQPGAVQQLINILVPYIIVIIVTPILVVVWRLLIQPNIAAPIAARFQEARNPELAEQRRKQREELRIIQEQRKLRDQMKQEATADAELGEPVMQYLSIFTPERNYDESIEIELPLDQGGDFLGQSGAVIAEAVDPDPIAIEVWLFDMFSQQNLKKIFITEAGNSDPSIRSRLEGDVENPATDIIAAAPGATVTLDSDKLRLQGKMASVSTNDNGRFQEFNLQLRAWHKTGQMAGTPASAAPPPPVPQPSTGSPPLSTYDEIQFDAPPPPSQSLPGSAASGGRPLSDYDDIQFDAPPPPSQSPPGSAASGGRPLSDYDDIQFDPPPSMPTGAQQPGQPPPFPTNSTNEQSRTAAPSDSARSQPPLFSGSPSKPPSPPASDSPQRLTPPPLKYPQELEPSGEHLEDEDDDPFGGTGEFTPLPNN